MEHRELEPWGAEGDDLERRVGHPRGTLAIVFLYGALFALGWAILYLWAFVPRGTPQP